MSDFSDTLYKLFVSPDSPNILTLHVFLRDWATLKANGAIDVMNDLFPGCESSPEQGFSVALTVDADKPPKGGDPEVVGKQLASIKYLLSGAPISRAFNRLAQGTSGAAPIVKVGMHKPTNCGGGDVYVIERKDRVNVIFAVDFQDLTDRALCRIFLHEFVEAQRSVNQCPPCDFRRGAEPPLELKDVPGIDRTPDIAGFVTFTLFKAHVETAAKCLNTTAMMVGYADYLMYHIKATKTYMHMRMRGKVADLLQVLNRATQESNEEKEKKTFGGKTFVRK